VSAAKAPGGASTILAGQAENHSHNSIESAVRAMSVPELAALLVGEISDFADFPCPACQPHLHDLLVHAPAASTLDGVIWSCASCGAAGTRWSLEATVLASVAAVQTVMAVSV